MKTTRRRQAPERNAAIGRRQRGIVLATALIILMVLSVLAVSLLRNYGTLERIADNTRDKQRAFNAAQNTLQYGEWWLTQGNAGAGAVCSGAFNASAVPSTAKVCSNALISTAATTTQAQISVVPWQTSAGVDMGNFYTPPGLTVSSTGGIDTYAVAPRFYVTSLGIDPTASIQLYQVSAMAQGGSKDTVAVVQSVYGVKSSIVDAGGL
jgi:type IV pilus assembly protein PilX